MATTERRRYAPKTAGALASFLVGLQGFTSVIHELLQNAEDAGATEFHIRFTPEALWVGNNEIFEDKHFAALSAPASASKRHEVEKIGSFGIGFTSVYQLTDAPEVMSRGQRHTLLPLEDAVDVDHDVEHEWETTIRLPWAFWDSDVREVLDSDPVRPQQLSGFLDEARAALTHSAVFLSHVKRLRIHDGNTVVEDIHVQKSGSRRSVQTLAGEVAYLIYKTEVRDPSVSRLVLESEREAQVRLAVPEQVGDNFQGFFYASLPTQERTFLPFHLDADFYPHSDRKSLLWDGNNSTKQRWNAAVLDAACSLLPSVLKDLRDAGAPALYSFAHACLAAPEQAAQTRVGLWVGQCTQTVRQAFQQEALLFGERTGWIAHGRLTVPVPGFRPPTDLQLRIESCSPLAFPPDDHLDRFASFFRSLRVGVLDAERFIPVLPGLLQGAAEVPAGPAVWDAIRPVVTYLRKTLEEHPHPERLLAPLKRRLRELPLAVDLTQKATTINDVWLTEDGWEDVPCTWWGEEATLSETWAEEAGPLLGSLLDILTPNDLLEHLAKKTTEEIMEITRNPTVLRRLYAFLGNASFALDNAAAVPLCRGKDGSLNQAARMVLHGEIKDPFGLVTELDPEMAAAFPAFFATLGVAALNGDRYFTQLLPTWASEHVDQRDAVLKYLSASQHMTETRRTAWREVAIVRTTQGQWVKPPKANFEDPLLDRLFPGAYNAVAPDLAEDKAVRRFLKLVGVASTPTPKDLARIVSERAKGPLNDAALALRRELVRHALAEPEVLKCLQDVPWLPDDALSNWWSAGQLWSPRRRVLIGHEHEVDRAFLGLELTEEQERNLGLAEPQVDTVLRHLATLKGPGSQVPPYALGWLEHQAMTETQLEKLRQLPLFLASDTYRESGYFFLQSHRLAPYRGFLSGEYASTYPRLIRALGIQEHPTPEDYVAVLLEAVRGVPDGGRVQEQLSVLVKYCLSECARGWKRKEPETAWLEKLRTSRSVPVGEDDDLRVLKPRDTLRLDLPEGEVKRYGLDDARPYSVQGITNTAFLRALGVRGLREVMQLKLLSSAAAGTPSAYTQRLDDLLSAIIRYLHHLHPDVTPEDLEKKVLYWRFVSMPTIDAEISFPTFRALQTRRVKLEYEVDRASHAILLRGGTSEFALGVALEQALALGEAPHLSALLTYSLRQAQEFLDIQKIGPLPESFQLSSLLLDAEAAHPGPLTPVAPSTLRPSNTTGNQPSDSLEPPPVTLPTKTSAAKATSQAETEAGPVRLRVSTPAHSTPGETPPPESVRPADTIVERQKTGSERAAPDHEPSGASPGLSPADLRQQGLRSAQNAAAGRDRIAGETGRGTAKPKSYAQRTGAKVRRTQLRFRNYVYVSADSQVAQSENRSEHNRAIDEIGMKFVKQFELLARRTPEDCSDEPEGGFDIRSEGAGGVRLIEVKTLSGPWGARGVTVSRKQMHTAFVRDDRFWLYVVECAASEPKLWCIRNPAWLATSYTFADDWADARYAEGPYQTP